MLQDRKVTLIARRHGAMSSMGPGQDASAPQAGADLAAARARLGASLPEMARFLRIRQPFLAALEEGRLDALPGSAYALAFLRSYAAALGLDPEEMARRFKAEAAGIGERIALEFPAPLPERGLPTGAMMVLALVLVVAAYAGWYRLSGEGRLPAEA
ncbi:MAG: helix-turn-helix domain-containing protein, partial [Rhodospirillales bacterium]|nr:helix-turn-helix domain-containing protein [Rhodospirillales bacterium]